jgi:hypothetical protein
MPASARIFHHSQAPGVVFLDDNGQRLAFLSYEPINPNLEFSATCSRRVESVVRRKAAQIAGLRPTVRVVVGFFGSQSKYRYSGALDLDAIKDHLSAMRGISNEHWAYLEVNGRRVDDDRIAHFLLRL